MEQNHSMNLQNKKYLIHSNNKKESKSQIPIIQTLKHKAMSELSNSITQAIKKKAEDYAKAQGSHDKPEITAHYYTSGYSDAIEMMIEFPEWLSNNGYQKSLRETPNNKWFKKENGNLNYYTTAELLTKYFETKQ